LIFLNHLQLNDVRFQSFDRNFLDQYLSKKNGVVFGIKEKADKARFHNGSHVKSHHFTGLVYAAVCSGTLPNTSVDSTFIYTHKLWYNVHQGKVIAHFGKQWQRVNKIRRQRIFAETKSYHHTAVEHAKRGLIGHVPHAIQ